MRTSVASINDNVAKINAALTHTNTKLDSVDAKLTGTNAGLEKLDPHSGFINEEEYKAFTKQSQGKFGGVGIRIKVDAAGQIIVESPIVGTPAYKAGVMAGDIIVKVDGKATDNLASKDVVDMIQGDPGTKVTLTVIHDGESK